jgi:predicted O-methyltransferase YrrM
MIKEAMRLRDTNKHQDLDELRRFVSMAVDLDVRRYLEIGSRNGDSFYAVMANLRPGAFGMSIDLPETSETMSRMASTLMELRTYHGQQFNLFYGSSTSFPARCAARVLAPFDLILIDGDHTYDGVSADWRNYSNLGTVVVVHDIDAPDGWKSSGLPNEVGRFWRDLQENLRPAVINEFITPGSKMGYGVVFR